MIRVTAAAVPGAQHVLVGNGAPCQDAARTFTDADSGLVILAVSDGHGDPQYAYSDEGARIAVDVAIDVLRVVASSTAGEETLIKEQIAMEWTRRVKHHARMIAARDGTALLWPEEVTSEWDEKVKPYGATLIAAAIRASSVLWLRIGDGEAVSVGCGDEGDEGNESNGNATKRIFPTPDKSMGQATYSLSMRSAPSHIHVAITDRPELLVLATDGVTDQYESDPSFETEWGTKMLERVKAKGWNDAMIDLPRFLGTTARDGDDCAVAMAWIEI